MEIRSQHDEAGGKDMRHPERVLAGKVAVVTGAGRGIGRAIAIGFGRAGAAVACAARSRDEIEDTASAIRLAGSQAVAIPTDVTDRDAVVHLFDASARHFGGIDIAVLNAGINADRHTVADSVAADWMRTLDVNLVGAYYCAQAAIPHLRARGAGRMITIGSGLGHHGLAGGSAYACSKAGLSMLTRVLAQELWPFRISVNELIPGPVQTDIDRDAGGTSSVFQIDSEWLKMPEDVVPLALFLASQPDVGPTAQSFSLMRRDR